MNYTDSFERLSVDTSDEKSGANASYVVSTVDVNERNTSSPLPQVAPAVKAASKAVTSENANSKINLLESSRLPSGIPDALQDNWPGIARSGLSEGAYRRIRELALEAQFHGYVELRPKSLRNFLVFWEEVRSVAPEPKFTLARNGNLVAEWHKSWSRHLDIEFKEDGFALYGLFSGKIVSEGRDVIKVLAQRLIQGGYWPV